MTTVVFRRPLRRTGPELPNGEIALQEPPVLPERQGGGMSMAMMYLPMGVSSGAMMLMFVQPGAKAVSYLASGAMALSMVLMLFGQLGSASGERKRRLKGARRDYLRYMTQSRRQVRKTALRQRAALAWQHPDPQGLWSVAMSSRLWERRVSHDDFGEVRIGTGEQRLASRIQAPQTKPVEDLEPLCASALRRFIRAYAVVPDLPVAIYLRAFARVLISGEEEVRRGMARAVLAQLAVFHSPEDLVIAVCASDEHRAQWEWVKWLPHALHDSDHDAAGQVRLITDSYEGLEQLLGEDFAERPRFDPNAAPRKNEPYLVVVLDGVPLPAGARIAESGMANTTVLDVSGSLRWKADRLTLRLNVDADSIETVDSDRTGKDVVTRVGRPDLLSVERCRTVARLIAPYRMGGSTEAADPLTADLELTSLLGIDDVQSFDPETFWAARSPRERLSVPIGVAEDGSPVELDIKESAQGGMGPHGMLIGATGSGKSELLRTLVISLAATHSSEVLNFVLVDFKGGATFTGLDALPHTAAVITNLADELPLVDRMQDALQGELVRRQEYLRRTGYSSLYEHERARLQGAQLDTLPTLFLVVDEFSELLSTKREFMDLFVMIGRLGRSLGVHLLLASQRLDEGRVHLLESHLSYRIGLRTFSAAESRSVLGVADAYQLPSSPGNGFLKSDMNLTRFKAAYVSGAYRAPERRRPRSVVERQVVDFGADYLPLPAPSTAPAEPAQEAAADSSRTLFALLLERLRTPGPPARQVWLPPLAEPPSLDQVLPPLTVDPQLGLTCAGPATRGSLSVALGFIDRPFDGLRELLTVNLSGAAGHVGVVGAPQSGKSTVLRTLVTALALSHTPQEVQFYCLDFGGGTLGSLSGLPHVAGVASRLESDRGGRIIAEVSQLLARRERRFAEQGVQSMAAYRRMRQDGRVTDDPWGDVFLVVDGWFTLRQEFEAWEAVITDIANRGLGYGIHVVISATRWSEIRPWTRDLISTRLELHLGDAIESEVSSRDAARVPAVPGRGLTTDAFHFLAALPRIDGSGSVDDLQEATAALVKEVAQGWKGPHAPALRMLPHTLPARELPAPHGDLLVPIGLDEQRLEPVWHDFAQHPHLMVFGDTETGKTNLLRLMARAVVHRYSPQQARIMIADYRRDLYEWIPEQTQLGYAVSESALAEMMASTAQTLQGRLPGPEITPDRLRRRDWWVGPDLFVLVDDYELVGGGLHGPLAPLLDLLPQGAEIGLHLIVARSSSGASRAMTDPVLRRLWELGTPGLLLSCGKEEGTFLGEAKPRQLPPGRATLVTRRQHLLLQTAFLEQPDLPR
ncbi:S-DNA-T family DNA segregation ATPase FtsK/SpoIIIE [Streptomyces sp. TLI_235]|nr:type VII secretion protein EccCa [Streptomyces sp. TLI_235]PBC69618.1 S-DNA-T family DNA segregation ATPase FtsK/SpoIIIE [Streptomyces sp. TLI_235]